MIISQPVSNYIAKSLLTTRGDMLSQGAAAAQRLAVGNSYQVLRSNGTDPQWNYPLYLYAWGETLVLRLYCWQIGDWDMDADANVSILHGLTHAYILHVMAYIQNDNGTIKADLLGQINGAVTGWITTDNSNINLYRVAASYFDSVDFDATPYNRGWVFALVLTYDVP